MIHRFTPMPAVALSALLALGAVPWASAQTEPFSIALQASAEDLDPEKACATAYADAEGQAQEQIRAHYRAADPEQDYSAVLVRQSETRSLTERATTLCEVDSRWQGVSANLETVDKLNTENNLELLDPIESVELASPIDSIEFDEPLIGSEQYIDGIYRSTCPYGRNGDLCWQRIVQQAQSELFDRLIDADIDLSFDALRYLDFEGRQRDERQRQLLEMTADGRFFFGVVDVGLTPIATTGMRIDRQASPTLRRAPQTPPVDKIPSVTKAPAPAKAGAGSNLDVTVFYSWDGNDLAQTDHLAISSGRFGVGLWTQNRIGFAIFSGHDQVGIADDKDLVKSAGGGYDTLGIGMGFRLWPERALSLENMLYYVDAQPYRALIDPGCTGCTGRTYQSDDYVQATVNLKTNSDGINVGWMFTWKLLQPTSGFDTLSSGLYLELQF
ncbi:hypothetical protein [Reinekea sp.]|jgi:hypothetical protein|uniref:hypothetical protein n=1 Tax=Reinekea sp. TaxID=1970455 RepID=UPI002A837F93|nr:hypothetical protein [Reinekea sp.]